jgi:hypothetical protein
VGPAALGGDSCRLDGPKASGWRASLSAGLLDTRLDFAEYEGPLGTPQFEAGLRQWSVTVSVARRMSKGLALYATAGVIAGGELSPPGESVRLESGFVASVGATGVVLDGRGRLPFVTASMTASHARTEDEHGAPYRATDVAASLAVGKAFGGWVAPYVAAKVFGGPVSWERAGNSLEGQDAFHHGVALGVAAALPGGFDLLLEAVLVGAKGATLAVGRTI